MFDKVSEQNVQSDTDYAALSFKRICAEFGISSGTGFRFEEGDNHGLGSVFIYVSYVGPKADHSITLSYMKKVKR